MKQVVQTYAVIPHSGEVEYPHEVSIGGRIFAVASQRVKDNGLLRPAPPVEYIDLNLRRQMMSTIEQQIYGSTR